ncbi:MULTISPECIES: hypothetical protein [unclassified Rhizobium]|uniref:hypothetical protein n=1 Tax=unclassified Rhizobium TaxID=2613769 RepID=UPI000EA85530|nr:MULTISPECIES: hypothetical protein [unclassified Rhizobium]AYG69314.1 hypothetical protein CCGE531_25110 [Rhizobium sp. CCGE531]AYG75693.1 hypothetical protein CCGE532_24615 [Rhizobium sp. CCGE532]
MTIALEPSYGSHSLRHPRIRVIDEALSEAEVFELGIRLSRSGSEDAFDHLLGATLAHAAAGSGGMLSPRLGAAMGGLLKNIARRRLLSGSPDSEFDMEFGETDRRRRALAESRRFVRLAGEAARHAIEEFGGQGGHREALGALAAAAELYAPALAAELESEGEWENGRMPSFDPFEYDPQMEYFLGGLVRSVGKVVKKVSNVASGVAKTVGRIPVVGDIARMGANAVRLTAGPAAIALDAGVRLAKGQRLDRALTAAVKGQINAARDQLRLAEMVAPFVPGIGTGVAAALGAANALAAGKPITQVVLAAARSAVPGGAIAQAAFDVALNLAGGKNIEQSLLAAARERLPGGPAAKAAFDGALALAQGKKLQDAAFVAAGRVLPPSPYAADALAFVKGVANGQNIQNAALSVVGKRALGSIRSQAARVNPTLRRFG